MIHRNRPRTQYIDGDVRGKKNWSENEDERLKELIQTHGIGAWTVISSQLESRTGKQCRERWHNHLDPAVLKGDWSEEEDRLIISLQKHWGNQWSKITKMLPGRTDNAVKNRWHAAMRLRKARGIRPEDELSREDILRITSTDSNDPSTDNEGSTADFSVNGCIDESAAESLQSLLDAADYLGSPSDISMQSGSSKTEINCLNGRKVVDTTSSYDPIETAGKRQKTTARANFSADSQRSSIESTQEESMNGHDNSSKQSSSSGQEFTDQSSKANRMNNVEGAIVENTLYPVYTDEPSALLPVYRSCNSISDSDLFMLKSLIDMKSYKCSNPEMK